MQVSRQEAAKELLRRRKARKHLIDYTRYTMVGYVPSKHHYSIADALHDVMNGSIKRLMIEMPPRHGKSELGSRRFPGYFIGHYPERSIMSASYNSDLASDFGRDVRNIVASNKHKTLFNESYLAADSQAAGRWHTNKGGGYFSAGIGTAATGRGCHILNIDDPFKDRKDADSEVMRDNVYNWYLSTAYTRLESTLREQDTDPLWNDAIDALEDGAEPFEGAIIIINTRWHEDDLCGRLLEDEKKGADKWERLTLPAIDSDGLALWPNKYPIKRLQEIKTALTTREWNALYQQSPKPEEGSFFKRKWFNRFHLGDEPLVNKYQSSDFAVSEDEGDFTEFGIFGVCPDENLYALDWWFKQSSSDEWIEAMLDQIAKHKPFASFGESGVIKKAIEPYLTKRSRQRKVYYRQEWITRTSNKAAMARSFQALAASGKVFIPYCEWGDRLIEQLCAFPAGKDDDAVDVCALIGMAIDQAHEAIVPPSKQPAEKRDSWAKAFNQSDSDSWATL